MPGDAFRERYERASDLQLAGAAVVFLAASVGGLHQLWKLTRVGDVRCSLSDLLEPVDHAELDFDAAVFWFVDC
jgi:hypothetical protein